MIYEIEFKDKILDVHFYADITRENDGIGSYEYWGMKGYDAGQDYWEVNDVDWNKGDFTDEENQYIEGHLDMYYKEIEEELIEDHIDYIKNSI